MVSFCGVSKIMSPPVSLILSSCGVFKGITKGYYPGVLDDVKHTNKRHSEQISHFACLKQARLK